MKLDIFSSKKRKITENRELKITNHHYLNGIFTNILKVNINNILDHLVSKIKVFVIGDIIKKNVFPSGIKEIIIQDHVSFNNIIYEVIYIDNTRNANKSFITKGLIQEQYPELYKKIKRYDFCKKYL